MSSPDDFVKGDHSKADNGQPVKKDRRLSSVELAVHYAMAQDQPIGSANDEAQLTWPTLWEWLSTSSVGEHIKTPATMTLRLGPEGVLIQLTDRDLGCSLEASCANLSDVFEALETVLSRPNPPFKFWGKKAPNLRKRKKQD